ncbi:glycosyltransferase family protein, partial [Methylocystis suflitae]|uniref:hypothetical protein n=1 Tax=Methylocystis suflitae TaxID=2951405 RepID=UPI002108B26D
LGCCTAFKSIMIPLIIPVPATYGHDGWINNLADALGCRKFIRTALQVYRRHSTNTSNHITTRINLISPFDLLKVRIKDWIKSEGSKGGAAVACETRIMQLEILRCRIVDSESYLREKCDLQSSAARARAEIDRAIAANTVRLDFQRRGALRRVIGATIFYINGGYREFEGWKSFAKDLLR